MALSLDKENPSEDYSLKGKKIFIVEDDVFLGSILSQRISSENAILTLFKDAEEALKGIEENIPDIILLDILLPGMDGFKFLEVLRGKEKTKSIPVLVVSNSSEVGNKEKARSMGAEFLLKALVTPHEIVEAVKRMLAGEK